ncbi:L-histidine N(alpha)-methyltransferase [Crenobacter sp. SG2303]|uniref:L-histidine N(Alpha)-methyltransferase n=1 Tax=Crenobacter oryzisoli TaxID=3056844 RepID=A0ABT7XT86_9NEIS|nr:L-histidine N(alpha)-methyltransferase [Crenobacter sp. SG2303]MDN0077011.1 L-histidine N(alpha)-methyltransferase [Crenobacter sp. SG2303]
MNSNKPECERDAETIRAPRLIIDAVDDHGAQLAELRDGLLSRPARIAPKFFYDEQGCALYGAICALSEYYPTRTEIQIYERCRRPIAAQLPPDGQWIDLGCGDGAKARDWLGPARVRRYIGVDFAADWLKTTLAVTEQQFPGVDCLGVVTDFTRPFHLHPVLNDCPDAPPIFFYPGSSIGNFTPEDALSLLRSIRSHLDGDGRLLIGVDLVKDTATVEAAYDDALGVTAAFNRNVLRVANRLLDADFEPHRFDHRAFFNATESRIEMHLAASQGHDVRIGEHRRRFEAGETIVTEYSYKYTPERFCALLAEAGYGNMHYWTDERGWFGVFVAEAGGD